MPQLDKLSFISQLLWFFSILFLAYIFLFQSVLLSLAEFILNADIHYQVFFILVFSILCAFFLAKILLRNHWFLGFLEKLSRNLWKYFMVAYPFYVVNSFFVLFSTALSVENVLIVMLVSFGLLFLIVSFYVNRGSDKLYGWLIVNTKIRVALVTFSLLSTSLFYLVFGGERDVQSSLSASLLIKLASLEAVISSEVCLLLFQSFLLMSSLFLSFFVSFLVWVSEQPFLVIISNFLASGIIIRGLFLHSFLLDAVNGFRFFSESVESTQMMFKMFNLKATLPELLGKTAVVPKSTPFNYPRAFERSVKSFSTDNVDQISLFLKKQAPLGSLKKILPFSSLETMLLGLDQTGTSLQHKQFVLYVVFESHRTGKLMNEIVVEVAQKLGIFSGTAEEIEGKLRVYGLNLSNESSLSIDSLNSVDVANAEKIYRHISQLRSQYSPQQLALTAHYLSASPHSELLRKLGLTATWSENFLFTKSGEDFHSQQLLQTRETIFQSLLSLDPRIQVLDKAQLPWKSFAAQKNVLSAGVHLRADILRSEFCGQVVLAVNSVDGNHLGDFKLLLANGRDRYVDVTQVGGESTLSLVANPESAPRLAVENMVKSVWKVVLEKYLQNEPKVCTSVHIPFISERGEEFEYLLSLTNKEFDLVRASAIAHKGQQILEKKGYIASVKSQILKNQGLACVERLEVEQQLLKGVTFSQVLEKTVITTSGNFTK